MMNKPTSSDIFDINKKTGALILGKNRLDDYATKYLARHCKEALETPMPLPVNEKLQKAKLTVQEVSLSRNLDVFGCCLLLDGEVEVYNHEKGTSKTVSLPAGTVLIDPDYEAMYGKGAKRNTLISDFEDFDAVFAEINNSKELVSLTPVEAYQLLILDSSLREWVSGGRLVFADGYFVLAEEKYITAKEDGLHLTTKAKKNLAQCVINIHEQKCTTYQNIQKDFIGFAVLHKVEGIDQRMMTFHPKYQANFKYEEDDVYSAFCDHIFTYDENEEIELVKRLSDPTTTLCQCLWYLMEKRKWVYPETFNDRTGLHKNYHGKIKNDKYNNMGTEVLMAICVGLRLNLRIVDKIFAKSDNKLNYYQNPDKTYILSKTCPDFPCRILMEF